MKLITIEGDVFRADRIDAIAQVAENFEVLVYLTGYGENCFTYEYDSLEMARSAHLRAVMDWKKALE